MESALSPKLLPRPIYAVVNLAIAGFGFVIQGILDSGKSLHSFFDVLRSGEGGEAEIALTGRSETCAGRADDVGLLQEVVKEVPGTQPVRGFHPDVRGIYTAIDFVAELSERFAD